MAIIITSGNNVLAMFQKCLAPCNSSSSITATKIRVSVTDNHENIFGVIRDANFDTPGAVFRLLRFTMNSENGGIALLFRG